MSAPTRMSGEPAPGDLSDDAFLGGALRLWQPRDGARSGIDAVLLAASVAHPADEPARVLEAGCGAGTVALCLAHRLARAHVTGVEIDPALCELARENAARNGLGARVEVIAGDVCGSFAALETHGVQREGYDHVVANPPYLAEGSARPPAAGKQLAHVMAPGGLEAWLRFLAASVKPRGRLWLIHRADALPGVLAALKGRFGGPQVFPMFPHEGAPAGRIIVTATKGSRAGLTLLRGLVLHQADGHYTAAAEAALRHGAALALGNADRQ